MQAESGGLKPMNIERWLQKNTRMGIAAEVLPQQRWTTYVSTKTGSWTQTPAASTLEAAWMCVSFSSEAVEPHLSKRHGVSAWAWCHATCWWLPVWNWLTLPAQSVSRASLHLSAPFCAVILLENDGILSGSVMDNLNSNSLKYINQWHLTRHPC